MFHPQGPTFYELAVQALSSTERGYDLLAPKFDYTPFRTPQKLVESAGQILAQRGPYSAGLDLCCGTGAGMTMLRPLCRERVVGVDFSRGMLDVCRASTADAPGDARLEYVQADVRKLSYQSEFDIAVCFGALGHIVGRDEQPFFRAVHDALRPGGLFAFISGYYPPCWSPGLWLARGFNLAMAVRNTLLRPPFIMYYLTFMLPGILRSLERAGFRGEVADLLGCPQLKLVIGTKELRRRTA
jgi:SAM-dependent methyltransferase